MGRTDLRLAARRSHSRRAPRPRRRHLPPQPLRPTGSPPADRRGRARAAGGARSGRGRSPSPPRSGRAAYAFLSLECRRRTDPAAWHIQTKHGSRRLGPPARFVALEPDSLAVLLHAAAAERGQAKRDHEHEGLSEDVDAHLGLPDPPFLERDRDFDDAGTGLTGTEGRLDLEAITSGVQMLEVDRAESRRSPGLDPACEVAERQQQDDAGEDAAATADQSPQDVPAWDLAAFDVPRPEHEVGSAGSQRFQQSWQEAHRMAEVGVDLDDDVGAAGQDVGEAGHVSAAQALLGLAVQDRDRRALPRQVVGEIAGAVRGAVVHEQDVSFGDRLEDGGADRTDVVALVVCRDDDPDSRACVRLDGALGDGHRFPWCERVAGENTLSLPYPARLLRGDATGRFPDTRKCPEEPFNRTAVPRVLAALVVSNGTSEDISLVAACAPATAGTATGSSTFRLPRPSLCASEPGALASPEFFREDRRPF